MRKLLETLIEESHDTLKRSKESIPRQIDFPKTENMIKVAIGMRRAGKTTLLYQTINQLIAQGISSQQILMINFEDDRLLPMSSKEMGALLDEFYSLYPDNHQQRCYFFLDEVQNVPDWQRVVRRFFDTKNIRLYLTGSSAKLLSTEIATSLRGRSLAVEVWPFSFDEYLLAHKIKRPTPPLGKQALDHLQQYLRNFFNIGGFPAVQHMPADEWRDTLQNYVDTVILRDVVERHNISNIHLLKHLATSLLKNAAAPFSVNKFYQTAKSQGSKVSKDTIYAYLDYLEDAFLAFTVPFYSESEREKRNIPKKIYAVDNGLIQAYALGTNHLLGKLLENQIYLDLRRQGKKIYFYRTKEGYEIDFITVAPDGSRECLQVVWDLSDPTTAQREQRALDAAQKNLKIPGRIITCNDYLKYGVGI